MKTLNPTLVYEKLTFAYYLVREFNIPIGYVELIRKEGWRVRKLTGEIMKEGFNSKEEAGTHLAAYQFPGL